MIVTIKPGRSRIFNGVRLTNPDRRFAVTLKIEPADRLTESPVDQARRDHDDHAGRGNREAARRNRAARREHRKTGHGADPSPSQGDGVP